MTISRRIALSGIALSVLAMAGPAHAAERKPYDPQAFEAAREAGKSIVVHVTAPWCGTCKAQKPSVAQLAGRPEFRDVILFDVDFDTQKEALRSLNVRSQSTFVVFKGRTETARSVGETRFEAIESLMRKAL
ncbi:thiol reductase thioredoxin [Microvirga ossetica]|uniref:Thiol reductase thioredoxin n=1 Tax=Microvirga ossetica TaxID=1882682 RepID=A0A1B2EMT8_9HYPH|nr:thioredoxin family protein [Microvirga ossetica]ANY81288.1 thiol reductase thioredoxin [Microvirga ossetica]